MTAIPKVHLDNNARYLSSNAMSVGPLLPGSVGETQTGDLLNFLLASESASVQRSMMRLLQEVADAGMPPAPACLNASAHAVAAQVDQELASQLRAAMIEGDPALRLHYQPLVAASGGNLVGFEALLRWTSPTRGQVAPHQVLRLAAGSGLADALDFWILQEAVANGAPWLARNGGLTLAVNVTGALISSSHAILAMRAALAAHGVATNRVCLEVTEEVLLDQSAKRGLHALQQAGFRLAIDDFGVGHSGLQRLHEFKADVVKLDMKFFLGRRYPDDDLAALRSLVRTLRQFGITVVAEGIAGPQDYTVACQVGCQVLQSFWFSEAISASAATELVETDRCPWSVSP